MAVTDEPKPGKPDKTLNDSNSSSSFCNKSRSFKTLVQIPVNQVIEISEDEDDNGVCSDTNKTLANSDASSSVCKTLTLPLKQNIATGGVLEASGSISREYGVGDFVWAYVRNLVCGYSWLPCRIYDPSAATDDVLEHKWNESSLLVYYFGDGAVGWRQPSELKPFVENFKELSKQSEWKGFVNAVEEAFNEVCLLMKSKLEHCDTVSCRRVINPRIKPEVVVPEGCIGRAIDEFINQPANVLTCVRNAARFECFGNVLEMALVKNWSSATGRHPLPIFNEPRAIKETASKTVNTENERKRDRDSRDENEKSSTRRITRRSRYLSYPYIPLPETLEFEFEDEIKKEPVDASLDSVKFTGMESDIKKITRKLEKMLLLVEESGSGKMAAETKPVLQSELMQLLEMVKKMISQVQ